MKGYIQDDKNTLYLPWDHSGYAVHKRMKRGRTGQIVAIGVIGYYGFTTIEKT